MSTVGDLTFTDTVPTGPGYTIEAGGVITSYASVPTMLATLAADTTYVIRPGSYDLTAKLTGTALDGVSIIGEGDVTLNLHMSGTEASDEGAYFGAFTNLLLDNIKFKLAVTSSNYGSANVYAVNCDAYSGIMRNCSCIMLSSLLDSDMANASDYHAIAFVQLTNASRQFRIEDCSFVAFNTNVANQAYTQCAATHAVTGFEYLTSFIRCNFISSKALYDTQRDSDMLSGYTKLIDCYTTYYTPYATRCGLLSDNDAKALIPSDLHTYVDGYKYSRSDMAGGVIVYSESATMQQDWHNIATFVPNTIESSTPFLGFSAEITGYIYRSGGICHLFAKYGVRTPASTTYIETLYEYVTSASMFQIVVDGDNVHLQMKANLTSTVKFHGAIKFIPLILPSDEIRYGEGEAYMVINETAPVAT